MRSRIMQEVREFADGLTRTRDFAIKVIKAAGLDDLKGSGAGSFDNFDDYRVYNLNDGMLYEHTQVIFDTDFSPNPQHKVTTLDYDTGIIHFNDFGLFFCQVEVFAYPQEDFWLRVANIEFGDLKVRKNWGNDSGSYHYFSFLTHHRMFNGEDFLSWISLGFMVYGYPVYIDDVTIRIWKVM